jgi:hypothetical protein
MTQQICAFQAGEPAVAATLNEFTAALLNNFGSTTIAPSIIQGLRVTALNLDVTVTAGTFHAPDQTYSFLPYNVPSVTNAPGIVISMLPNVTGYIIVTFSISPQTPNQSQYNLNGVVSFSTTAPLPTDPIVILAGVTSDNTTATLDLSIRAIDYEDLIQVAQGSVRSINDLSGVVEFRFNNLLDVRENNLQNNQVTKYNNTNDTWDNGNVNVSELGDVTLTNLENNQVLLSLNEAWKNSTLYLALNSDINFTQPFNNKQFIGLDNSAQTWINRQPTIDDISDIVITNPVNNQLVKFNSTNQDWNNGFAAISELSDVTLTNLENNQVLLSNSNNFNNSYLQLSLNRDVVFNPPLDAKQFIGYNVLTDKWTNTTLDFTDLGDVNITNPQNKQVPQYNNTSAKWENKALTFDLPYPTSQSTIEINPISVANNSVIVLDGNIANTITLDDAHLFPLGFTCYVLYRPVGPTTTTTWNCPSIFYEKTDYSYDIEVIRKLQIFTFGANVNVWTVDNVQLNEWTPPFASRTYTLATKTSDDIIIFNMRLPILAGTLTTNIPYADADLQRIAGGTAALNSRPIIGFNVQLRGGSNTSYLTYTDLVLATSPYVVVDFATPTPLCILFLSITFGKVFT